MRGRRSLFGAGRRHSGTADRSLRSRDLWGRATDAHGFPRLLPTRSAILAGDIGSPVPGRRYRSPSNLWGCNLPSCNLRGCHLRSCHLRGCSRRSCHLRSCHLRNCNLWRDSTRRHDLRHCKRGRRVVKDRNHERLVARRTGRFTAAKILCRGDTLTAMGAWQFHSANSNRSLSAPNQMPASSAGWFRSLPVPHFSSSALSFAGSVTGNWQTKFSQTYAAGLPSMGPAVFRNSSRSASQRWPSAPSARNSVLPGM